MTMWQRETGWRIHAQSLQHDVNLHVGPAVVPRLRLPVLWAQTDRQLEGCGEHHVGHHTQQAWRAENTRLELDRNRIAAPPCCHHTVAVSHRAEPDCQTSREIHSTAELTPRSSRSVDAHQGWRRFKCSISQRGGEIVRLSVKYNL